MKKLALAIIIVLIANVVFAGSNAERMAKIVCLRQNENMTELQLEECVFLQLEAGKKLAKLYKDSISTDASKWQSCSEIVPSENGIFDKVELLECLNK